MEEEFEDGEIYEQTTDQVTIAVSPVYDETHSEPDEGRYLWAYRVRICNLRENEVTLRKRFWRITNALGEVQEVSGEGVVGRQPLIKPGEVFEYLSGAPLNTPSGFMCGRYLMETHDGELFDVHIPAFALDLPNAAPRRLN